MTDRIGPAMELDRFETLLQAESDGEISPEELQELEAACEAYPELARLRRRDRHLASLIASLPPEPAPPTLARAVLQQLEAEGIIAAPPPATAAHSTRTAGDGGRGPRAVAAAPRSGDRPSWWRVLVGSSAVKWGFAMAVFAFAALNVTFLLREGEIREPTGPPRPVATLSSPADEASNAAAAAGRELAALPSPAPPPESFPPLRDDSPPPTGGVESLLREPVKPSAPEMTQPPPVDRPEPLTSPVALAQAEEAEDPELQALVFDGREVASATPAIAEEAIAERAAAFGAAAARTTPASDPSPTAAPLAAPSASAALQRATEAGPRGGPRLEVVLVQPAAGPDPASAARPRVAIDNQGQRRALVDPSGATDAVQARRQRIREIEMLLAVEGEIVERGADPENPRAFRLRCRLTPQARANVLRELERRGIARREPPSGGVAEKPQSYYVFESDGAATDEVEILIRFNP